MTLLADLIKKRESRVIATATPATRATPATKVAKVAKVARVNLQTDHTAEPDKAEKLHELSLLIEYVAENNEFSDEDIIEAKSNAKNDLENALVCFRELAADCRLVKVNAMLKANPGSLRALYTDTQSDPNNVILTVAIRGMAACEMHISKKKFDAFQLLALIEASEQQTH